MRSVRDLGVFAEAELVRLRTGYVFPIIVKADAASRGNLEAVQWLHSHGMCGYDTGTALEKAGANRHSHVVDWLLRSDQAWR